MAQKEISTHIPPSNNSWQPYWDQTALWQLWMEIGNCGTLEQPKPQEGDIEKASLCLGGRLADSSPEHTWTQLLSPVASATAVLTAPPSLAVYAEVACDSGSDHLSYQTCPPKDRAADTLICVPETGPPTSAQLQALKGPCNVALTALVMGQEHSCLSSNLLEDTFVFCASRGRPTDQSLDLEVTP